MSVSRRQLRILLRTFMRLDFRSRTPLGGGRRSRSGYGLAVALGFYLIVGSALGFSTDVTGLDSTLRMTLLLAVVSVYLAFSILIEYQQILLSPTDADVLSWRPISSRTLFVARSLHIFLYVNLLSAALLLVPSILMGMAATRQPWLSWVAFALAGTLNAVLVTAIVILSYSLLLRHVSATRLQDALAWFQVIMSLLVFLGYQALGPLLQRAMTHDGSLDWLRLLPARWFAALPELVGWGVTSEAGAALAVGLVLTGLVLVFAIRDLAPQFQDALAAQSEGVAPSRAATSDAARRRAGPTRWGRWVLRGSTERAGYDFFVAMFRGDPRLKTTLAPLMIIPVAFLLFGLTQGVFPDPYAKAVESTGSEPSREAVQALRMSYFAVYFMVFTALSLVRSLAVSPSWKAAWVFYASPLARFDRFHRGVLWGATWILLIPTILLLAVVLTLLWHDLLHVVVHLSVPVGMMFVVLPLSLWLRPEPPFSREPMRHDRMGEFFGSILYLLPLIAIAVLQYELRGMGWILLLGGLLLVLLAALLSWVMQHRVQTTLHAHSFDA